MKKQLLLVSISLFASMLLSAQTEKEYIANGKAAYNKGDRNEALRIFSEMTAKFPKNKNGWNNRGYLYFLRGEDAKAIEDYSRAINLDDKDISLYLNRSDAYLSSGNYNAGLADLTKVIELSPTSYQGWLGRGRAFNGKNLFDKAIADLNKALSLKPEGTAALTERGLSYSHLKKYDEAIADFDKAISLEPDFIDPYIDKAQTVHLATLKFEEPIRIITEGIKKAPEDDAAKGYCNRGDFYLANNNYTEALNDYVKFLSIAAPTANVLNNAGTAEFKLKKYDDAIKSFSYSITMFPTYVTAYANRANTYAEIGQASKGMADVESGLAIDPENEDVLVAKAYCLVALNRKNEAQEIYEKLKAKHKQ
jgi:superkiller protein 3